MNEPPRLTPKSLQVLRLIADGLSYSQIIEREPSLNYHDIFFAAEEALWLDERFEHWVEEAGPVAPQAQPGGDSAMSRAKELHPRAYAPWDDREDSELKGQHQAGKPVADLAATFSASQEPFGHGCES